MAFFFLHLKIEIRNTLKCDDVPWSNSCFVRARDFTFGNNVHSINWRSWISYTHLTVMYVWFSRYSSSTNCYIRYSFTHSITYIWSMMEMLWIELYRRLRAFFFFYDWTQFASNEIPLCILAFCYHFNLLTRLIDHESLCSWNPINFYVHSLKVIHLNVLKAMMEDLFHSVLFFVYFLLSGMENKWCEQCGFLEFFSLWISRSWFFFIFFFFFAL